jgi:hypothetical protein
MRRRLNISSRIAVFGIYLFMNALQAQTHFDCMDALEVCTDTSFYMEYPGIGVVVEDLGGVCGSTDPSTLTNFHLWLQFNFAEGGDFIFDLIPDAEDGDIDFLVFRTMDESCEDLHPVRCMFSGENVGLPGDEPCLGPTGLSFSSTDTLELPGCEIGDDNYLAPVQVANNEVLYVAIYFFDPMPGLTVIPGGTANLSCTPVSAVSDGLVSSSEVRLFPNPVSNQVNVQLLEQSVKERTIQIIDVTGREVWRQPTSATAFSIPTYDFLPGMYWVNIWDEDQRIASERMIVQ